MMHSNFSRLHHLFVKDFPARGFEDCLKKLEYLEQFVSNPEQQEKHDALVEATYEFYQVLETEDLGYVICTE